MPDELPVKEADNADEGDGTHCTNTNDEIAIHSPRQYSQDDDGNDDDGVDKNGVRVKRTAAGEAVDEGKEEEAATACCRL